MTDDPATRLRHLPVTVRGDRLGVLSVRPPAEATDVADVPHLAEFATALGHEVDTAGRDTAAGTLPPTPRSSASTGPAAHPPEAETPGGRGLPSGPPGQR
ncbi:hypothetical protein [Streptomyces sp. NPDC005549]|uniref:hypothetical protein n=1 Tax=Streptomyces sp. NPDC005549 TaxID=3154888 RepID=UPI0033B6439F